jgi:hypothetical protein
MYVDLQQFAAVLLPLGSAIFYPNGNSLGNTMENSGKQNPKTGFKSPPSMAGIVPRFARFPHTRQTGSTPFVQVARNQILMESTMSIVSTVFSAPAEAAAIPVSLEIIFARLSCRYFAPLPPNKFGFFIPGLKISSHAIS